MAYITPLAATHEADTSDAHDASAISIETVKSWGVAQEASAFTAPATATLAAAATAFVPTIGMSLRTLVA